MTRLLALLLITSCASQPQHDVWARSDGGGSQSILNVDDGQCKAQAFGVPGANTLQVAAVYNACMQGKGWYRKPN